MVRFVLPFGSELTCAYRLTSAVNLKLKTPQQARDVLHELPLMTNHGFIYKGRPLTMWAAMLQTRVRRGRYSSHVAGDASTGRISHVGIPSRWLEKSDAHVARGARSSAVAETPPG